MSDISLPTPERLKRAVEAPESAGKAGRAGAVTAAPSSKKKKVAIKLKQAKDFGDQISVSSNMKHNNGYTFFFLLFFWIN